MDSDIDFITMPRQMLINGVVQDLGNAVMEGPLIGATDIHSGLFADGLEAFELPELGRIVVGFDDFILRRRNRVGSVGHADLGK